MHVQARTAKNGTQDQPGLQLEYAGMRVAALNDRPEFALGGMDVMTTAYWAALRLEIHQKLQELKRSGDGYWERIKSDFETKIAALEASIRLSNPCSGIIRPALGVRQQNKTARSAKQTGPKREHSELKKVRTNTLPNLAA